MIKNCKMLALALQSRGIKLVSDGTDSHVLLWELRPRNIDGARFERVGELCEITLDRNTCPGDKSTLVPGGVRILTSFTARSRPLMIVEVPVISCWLCSQCCNSMTLMGKGQLLYGNSNSYCMVTGQLLYGNGTAIVW